MGQKISTFWGIVQEDDFGNQRTFGAKLIDPAAVCVQPKSIDDFHYPDAAGADNEDGSSHSEGEVGEGEVREGEEPAADPHMEGEEQVPMTAEAEEEKRQ